MISKITRFAYKNKHMNELWFRNWHTLLHTRLADSASALTKWHHFSAQTENPTVQINGYSPR